MTSGRAGAVEPEGRTSGSSEPLSGSHWPIITSQASALTEPETSRKTITALTSTSTATKGADVPLKYRVFLHSHLGFNSNSTLFYGERDAILIDACQLLSDAHKMVAEIIPMRKNLTHIYVSHFHPDHHFALGVLQFAFPSAKIVALPSVVKDIVFTAVDKLDTWSIDRFGPDIPSKTTVPMPLREARLELEGEELLFSDDWEGDSINNSVVRVPSMRVVCATELAFHDCNLSAHGAGVAAASAGPAGQDLSQPERRVRRRPAQGVRPPAANPPAHDARGRRAYASSRSLSSLLAKPVIMSTGGHPQGSGMTLESHT